MAVEKESQDTINRYKGNTSQYVGFEIGSKYLIDSRFIFYSLTDRDACATIVTGLTCYVAHTNPGASDDRDAYYVCTNGSSNEWKEIKLGDVGSSGSGCDCAERLDEIELVTSTALNDLNIRIDDIDNTINNISNNINNNPPTNNPPTANIEFGSFGTGPYTYDEATGKWDAEGRVDGAASIEEVERVLRDDEYVIAAAFNNLSKRMDEIDYHIDERIDNYIDNSPDNPQYIHPTSGVTPNTYGPTSGGNLSHGNSFDVPCITVNEQGHVTSASTRTYTLPSDGGTTYNADDGVIINNKTIKANLLDYTESPDSASKSNDGTLYAVELDKRGHLSVRVPASSGDTGDTTPKTKMALHVVEQEFVQYMEEFVADYIYPATGGKSYDFSLTYYAEYDKAKGVYLPFEIDSNGNIGSQFKNSTALFIDIYSDPSTVQKYAPIFASLFFRENKNLGIFDTEHIGSSGNGNFIYLHIPFVDGNAGGKIVTSVVTMLHIAEWGNGLKVTIETHDTGIDLLNCTTSSPNVLSLHPQINVDTDTPVGKELNFYTIGGSRAVPFVDIPGNLFEYGYNYKGNGITNLRPNTQTNNSEFMYNGNLEDSLLGVFANIFDDNKISVNKKTFVNDNTPFITYIDDLYNANSNWTNSSGVLYILDAIIEDVSNNELYPSSDVKKYVADAAAKNQDLIFNNQYYTADKQRGYSGIGNGMYILWQESSNTSGIQSSDIRLKTIKRDLDLNKCYDLIDKCQTVIYTLNSDPTQREQVGVIAQEIQEFFPEIVVTQPNGYLAVDYSKLTVIILRVLKDLIDEVKLLKSK